MPFNGISFYFLLYNSSYIKEILIDSIISSYLVISEIFPFRSYTTVLGSKIVDTTTSGFYNSYTTYTFVLFNCVLLNDEKEKKTNNYTKLIRRERSHERKLK